MMKDVVAENSLIDEIRNYAILKDIPIMQVEGLSFLCSLIKEKNIKHILEIGTAIGYSASVMHLSNICYVTSIERDDKMFDVAKENINKLMINDYVNLVFGDALCSFEKVSNKTYDLIFIDAAKGQYQKFFEIYSKLLNDNGIIVCDNLAFHGLVENTPLGASRNLKNLLKKIRTFIIYLKENELYDTSFFNIGDGISVSKKKILHNN